MKYLTACILLLTIMSCGVKPEEQLVIDFMENKNENTRVDLQIDILESEFVDTFYIKDSIAIYTSNLESSIESWKENYEENIRLNLKQASIWAEASKYSKESYEKYGNIWYYDNYTEDLVREQEYLAVVKLYEQRVDSLNNGLIPVNLTWLNLLNNNLNRLSNMDSLAICRLDFKCKFVIKNPIFNMVNVTLSPTFYMTPERDSIIEVEESTFKNDISSLRSWFF